MDLIDGNWMPIQDRLYVVAPVAIAALLARTGEQFVRWYHGVDPFLWVFCFIYLKTVIYIRKAIEQRPVNFEQLCDVYGCIVLMSSITIVISYYLWKLYNWIRIQAELEDLRFLGEAQL